MNLNSTYFIILSLAALFGTGLVSIVLSTLRGSDPTEVLKPLLFESSDGNGTWKLSMGRVSFWLVMALFCWLVWFGCHAIIEAANRSGEIADVGTGVVTLYGSILTMVFLLLLGLLGYNLGTKFTNPMTQIMRAYGGSKLSGGGGGGSTPSHIPTTEPEEDLGEGPPITDILLSAEDEGRVVE